MGVCSPVQRQGDPPRRKMVLALNPSRAPWPMLAGPRYTEGPFGIPKIEGHFWCALAVVACATDEPIDISLTVSMHHGTNTILGGAVKSGDASCQSATQCLRESGSIS